MAKKGGIMPDYETVFILKPTLSAEKVEEVLEKIKGVITSNKGSVTLSDSWGKRRLAYPVKKHKEGSYYLFHFSSEGKVVGELENYFRTTDNVIKYITIKIEKSFKKNAEAKKEKKPDQVKTESGNIEGPVAKS
ncbi:MAG: 30S ribosomal protein S6 [Elusimicrobia bacterium]|nr:30S ribosomal protein S6 [Elusimicrobiota bacterium]